ncbi:UBP-type zinc finger domain-containing protein [Streptomyces sp. J2-1]|uniref:UBP-type zinc finger domain-containing protein n=1 Tax=Streptomyces corallincola TaxID=2851888 RepID=UPI001C38D17A|nr:UBP-type zinc finger domain-containing protein [Streptomyces corallincola]MBV2355423.1 UBP-type zinc finger domain-containing protein [Streptomyces corallincola]
MTTWTVRPDGGRPESTRCAHLDQPAPPPPTGRPVCEECAARGRSWVHLRVCLTCGHTGCCDSSPAAHANAHYERTAHPVAAALEPSEHWAWCYTDVVFLERR